jgi:crossover junction endodeoxyribonuclease RusA
MRLYRLFRKIHASWDLLRKRLDERPPGSPPEESFSIPQDLEPSFPIEFMIEAVPLSLQASASSREAWRQQIRAIVDETIDPGGWATESPVHVTIFYFPDGPMAGDIDNIVKPILDALMPRIYLDDSQVERVWVQKFESERAFQFENPSVQLAEAIDTERPVVYIRIDNEASTGS